MPARNRPQSNAMLYTLITFVGLFIIAAAAAVIFYVKFEDRRTTANQSKRELEEFANKDERQRISTLVGTREGRTWLRTMVYHLDTVVSLVKGGPPGDKRAEDKVKDVIDKVENKKQLLAQEYVDIGTMDPNTSGLIQIVEKLKTKLDNITTAAMALEKQLDDLHNRFDDALAASSKKEQTLLAEKERYAQQVSDIKQKYDELEASLRKNSGQQIQDLIDQRDRARAERDELKVQMREMGATLSVAQDRIAHLQGQIQATMPSPDPNAPAYQPDGKIIMVDNRTVHLNIGRDDRVYRGLTFTVYDRSMPIPKDGIGKAEIEVFDVRKNFSGARITYSQKTNPIVVDDVVANLIWDSKKTNVFMVAGDFDLDGDGYIDYDAVDKIKAIIVKWGGRVTDAVSVDTDFLVLGRPPRVLRKPTFGEIEMDPLAMQKYEASLGKLAYYNQVRAQARALYIPVFNTERFLYFIGYKTQAGRPGAFY